MCLAGVQINLPIDCGSVEVLHKTKFGNVPTTRMQASGHSSTATQQSNCGCTHNCSLHTLQMPSDRLFYTPPPTCKCLSSALPRIAFIHYVPDASICIVPDAASAQPITNRIHESRESQAARSPAVDLLECIRVHYEDTAAVVISGSIP